MPAFSQVSPQLAPDSGLGRPRALSLFLSHSDLAASFWAWWLAGFPREVSGFAIIVIGISITGINIIIILSLWLAAIRLDGRAAHTRSEKATWRGASEQASSDIRDRASETERERERTETSSERIEREMESEPKRPNTQTRIHSPRQSI